jgi:hypothetical protein
MRGGPEVASEASGSRAHPVSSASLALECFGCYPHRSVMLSASAVARIAAAAAAAAAAVGWVEGE